MHFLIDRHQMAVIHVHASKDVLQLLSWIECANYGVVVKVGDATQLRATFDGFGVKRIYQNLTGGEMNPYSTRLPHALFEAVKRAEVTDAVLEEAESQVKYVKDGDRMVYLYRRGAALPDKHQKEVAPPMLKVQRVESDETYSFTPTVTRDQQSAEAADRGTTTADIRTPWRKPPPPAPTWKQNPTTAPAAGAIVAPWARPAAEVPAAPPSVTTLKPWEKKNT